MMMMMITTTTTTIEMIFNYSVCWYFLKNQIPNNNGCRYLGTKTFTNVHLQIQTTYFCVEINASSKSQPPIQSEFAELH